MKQVAEKIEQSSTFCNVAKQIVVCNMTTATGFATYYHNYGTSG